ncbi:MAG: glycosyltransferase [Bacteroidetes bacterium]|nr:glycosyltransferase [Bacteroidota bacterium]
MSIFTAKAILKSHFISVVIPARDEEQNIGKAIISILAQNYPEDQFEIVVVNDHSVDDTAKVVESFGRQNVRLLNLADIPLRKGEVAFKKRAIEEAVNISRGEIIVTTDADCEHHKNWLKTISSAFEESNANIISGPVLFHFNNSIFQRFQALDFLGMIGITAASLKVGMFNLANGANLAFRKSIFHEVSGYAGIDRQASGDDMLLIYKFSKVDAAKVLFLKSKEAVVYTRPAASLDEFVQQRLRWTSKSFGYQDHRITLILAFVYLVNVLLAVSLLAGIFLGKSSFVYCFILQFIMMSIVDFIFLRKVAAFFDRKTLLRVFIPSQFLHVVYIIVIGLLGNVVQYKWKGRKLK